MKDFLKKNNTVIWCLLNLLAVLLGIFIDVTYGFIVVLLIGVYCYIVLDDITSNLETFDRFGATFVGFLLHLFCYILIIVFVSFIVDTEEIKKSKSYEIKYKENGKILIEVGKNIQMLNDSALYWECEAKNCKNIIIILIEEVPVNSIYSKDLFLSSRIKYSAD